MPTYLYFGEDEFFLSRTIKQLKTDTLDQQWANFNYTEYPPESKETIPQALSDLMTPPVGSGGGLVHQQHISGSLFKRNFVAVGVHSPQNSTEAQRTHKKEN
ncbi:MAG: hypothetical protein AN488_13485 [Anabaena sp. WA113]|jgi:DNA polymerase III delta subunit|uniref:DNA polymerase III delta N-terminal domain-containing protein n=1 Tax=Aphanizomenon flos-aquae WA102 TaxID=1710896 RepID=A0A1B7X4R4_APHFL|nr:MAG: hypothetical protein AN488_13485 [Anabaena sp. WA113]OBQ44355.1 MAG: hypothetical protein AN484_07420 [Aphanizomenon flos-aquae WA102]